MSELILTINGKDKTFYLDQPNPPSEAQVMEIKRVFLAHNPNWGKPVAAAPSAQPPALSGTITPQGTKKTARHPSDVAYDAKPAKYNPATDKLPGETASTAPFQVDPNAIMGKLPKPNLGLTPTPDLKTPEGQKLAKETDQRLREEAAEKPLGSGSFTLPNIQGKNLKVDWVMRGHGFEAVVDGQMIRGADRPTLAKKVRDHFAQKETQRLSPNIPEDSGRGPGLQFGNERQSGYVTMPDGKLKQRTALTGRDHHDILMKSISDMGSTIGGALSNITPTGLPVKLAELSGLEVPEVIKTIANLPSELGGQAIGGALTLPIRVKAKWDVLQSDEYTLPEKLETAAGVVAELGTIGVGGIGSKSLLDATLGWIGKSFGSADEFIKAIDNLDLEPNKIAAAKQFVKDNPEFTFKGIEDGKPRLAVKSAVGEAPKAETPKAAPPVEKVEAPKAETPKPPGKMVGNDPDAGATGLANQVADRERAAGKLGKEFNIKGKSIEDLHKEGKRRYEAGEINIEDTMRKLAGEGRTATGVEYGAALEHKRRLLSRINDAKKAVDDAIAGKKQAGNLQYDLDRLEKEVTDWQNLVDESKTAWSDSGRGLQIGSTINEGNLAEVLLERRRKLGRDLTKGEKAGLERQVNNLKASVMGKGIPWSDDADQLLKNIETFGAKNVDRVKAEAVLRTTARRTAKGRSIEQVRQARKDAASRISSQIAKSTAHLGAGPMQAFSDLRQAIPDIVDDVKIIIRSVAEEYQIRKLDKSLFDKVRKELPGLEITDEDIIRTLAGEYDAQTAKEPTIYAELTRQARKQNAEPLRKAKAALAEDLKKAQAEVKAAEKKIADAAKINAQRVEDAKKQGQQIEDDAARSLKEESQRKADEELKATNKKLSDAKRNLKKLEDRMATLDDIEEQVQSGGFWESVQQVKKATKEQQMLDLTIKGKRRQIRGLIRERDLKPFERNTKAIADTARSLRLGSDAGMLLRQGLYTLGRGKANLEGLRSFIKAVGDEDAWTAINESYYYKEAKDGRLLEPIRSHAGLATSDVFLDPEEITVIRILKGVPGLNRFVGALERGQSAFINTVRREIFDDFVNKFPDATEAELAARARFINAATGRSNWKDVPKMAQYVMTSPRYTHSRWELFGELLRNPVEAFKSKAARENLKDLGATAGSVLAILKIMESVGFDVSWDPMSSDFLKVRRGNTVYDPTAGLGKVARAVFRSIVIADKHRRGEKVDFGTNVKDIIGDTLSDTASPIITGTYTGVTGKTIAGYDAKPHEKGFWLLAPLLVTGFAESWSQDGLGEAALNAVPEFFGVGVNRYASKEMDELGRPKSQIQSGEELKVLAEFKRLGAKVDPNDRRKTDTDKTWQARTKAQGDAIFAAVKDLIRHPAYLKLTPTEKKKELMDEVGRIKTEFNREFNEAEKARKDDENVRRIEKEMAAGAR